MDQHLKRLQEESSLTVYHMDYMDAGCQRNKIINQLGLCDLAIMPLDLSPVQRCLRFAPAE